MEILQQKKLLKSFNWIIFIEQIRINLSTPLKFQENYTFFHVFQAFENISQEKLFFLYFFWVSQISKHIFHEEFLKLFDHFAFQDSSGLPSYYEKKTSKLPPNNEKTNIMKFQSLTCGKLISMLSSEIMHYEEHVFLFIIFKITLFF